MLPRLCSPLTRALASKQCKVTLANKGHRKIKTQYFSTCKRHFSPAAALANEPPKRSTQATVSPRLAARNVLKFVTKLVPRTISGSSQKVWQERAQSAFDDLELGQNRPTRIAVWGDEISGAAELVTSLLDDPLSNDSEQRNRIHQRWMSDVPHDNTIWIRTNDRPPLNHQTLDIKSSWLHGLNAEIVECRGVDAFATLLSSDHIIFVTDNIRLLSAPGLQPLLQKLSHAPSIHLIVNERAPGVPVPQDDLSGIVPTVIKPEHATRGLRAFARGDISQYQALLMESGVPQLAQRISHQCSESGVPSSASSTVSLAVIRTATHTARATLAACETAIVDAQNTLSTTTAPLGLFKTEVNSIYPAAYQSVLRGTTTVREGEAIVEKRLRTAFGRLPWYSLWWRADEVSGTLSEAISWGSLGTQLAFHAGRLSNTREQLYLRAVDLAFPSPILKNRLAQINTRTSVGPDALASPLIKRTAQLLAPGGPVEDVHRKAQGVVMTTAANILGSGVVGTGLFIAGSVGAGTAVGLGLLGSVASMRWMQSAWARAEKRWWADWTRVCTGLERDCEVALKEVVRERVTGSAVAGIEGMETIVARRARIISALKSETTDLKQEIVDLEQRLK